jgi:D-alanyl-D-alanine carboxypeptidase/D-alanyl-D-alanine-endopeptidase (penicillin-binding protein 4)
LRRLFVLALLATGCATTKPLLTVPELRGAIWGIDVEDDAGRVLYAQNAQTLLMPASNRKLFSAATVADCEGFDHQYATELWLDGRDLVIRGGGDPSFGGRYAFDLDSVFAPFVDALRRRGITSVDGDLVADVSLFDRVTIPGSWEVGDLPYGYAAPVDALAFAENVDGDKAAADPATFTAEAFRAALAQAGIPVRGAIRVNTVPRAWQERIAVIPSPFLFDLLRTELKYSDNLFAEMLFKGLTGTYEGSEAVEARFLGGSDFRFVDGCGLSTHDLVTPAAVVRLLRWMNDPVRRRLWWQVLAAPGDEGTLRRRLPELAARLRGKTGTISGVNALSGIIAMPGGGYRYFAVIVNHHIAGSGAAVQAIDTVVREIAR